MKLKKWAALALSAALATCMLTGCPWEKDDDSSSDSPSSSSRPHHDSSDEDDTGTTGDEDTETPENPDQPEETKPTLEKDGYEIDDKGNYTVNSEAGLLAWREEVTNDPTLNCILTDNITFSSGTSWTPIGNDNETPYNGEFDGQGHTISGLNVTAGENGTGMFGSMSGTVKNLKLENVSINGGSNAGGIAGSNGGTITGCMVTGTVSGTSHIGGVVGYIESGTVEDCYWKAGTDSDLKGIGTGSGTTTEVTGRWTDVEGLETLGFVIGTDGKPVPKVIAEQNKEDIPLINNPLTRFVLGL